MKAFSWFVGLFKDTNGNGRKPESEEACKGDGEPDSKKEQQACQAVLRRDSQKLRIDLKEVVKTLGDLSVELAEESKPPEGCAD